MITKKETINIRVTDRDKETINRAARMMGTNVSSFMIHSAMERAQEILEYEERIELTPQEMKKLVEVIESDEPNEKLKKSFREYEKIFL